MKNITYTILAIILSSSFAFGQFADGDGSKTNPYQVSTADQLNEVRNYLSSYFIQTNNIDLKDYDHNNDGKGWMPIGGAGTNDSFTGNYDGQSFVITNLYINRPNKNDIGLFGLVGSKSSGVEVSIKNIGLKNLSIFGDNGVGTIIGGLVSNEATTVEFSYAIDGRVSGNGNLGGLIGYAHSYQTNASTRERPTITKTFTSVDVIWSQKKSGNSFGGLIGSTTSVDIDNSYSRSSVTIDNTAAGLFSLEDVGGLIGDASNKTSITHSYSTGLVTAIGSPAINHIGGMIGASEGNVSVSNSYWDTQSSGQSNSDGGNGHTSSQMNNISTFSGFDFVNIWGIDNNSNDGYPFLKDDKWGILPIKLEYFDVQLYNNKVELEWSTSAEINNDFFSIERSSNGIDFELIETIKGAGNSSSDLTYLAIDENPISGINYYRLKQTDFDGKFEYFEIKSVELESTSNDISIYPNPNNGNFTISVDYADSFNFKIVDYTGKTIQEGQINSFETNIELSDISAGVYFLMTNSNTEYSITQRIIIQ